MSKELPSKGFVFWPVGTGDSTTIVIREQQTIMQIDLHDKSDGDSEKYTPIVDRLKELLPKRNGKPYLSVFVLTHPDQDHTKGLTRLLKEVDIDEIWHTPRIFREYEKNNELCDDAKAIRKECNRRREVTINKNGKVAAGDRVRIIGHDTLFENDEKYKNFPKEWRSMPGTSITRLDDEELSSHFNVFIHAPFKDTCEEDRNESSLAMQIKLLHNQQELKGLFFGDLSHFTLKSILDKTREKEVNYHYLEWHVFQAPHHCSKYAMYKRVDKEDVLQTDPEILSEYEKHQLNPAYVIASCDASFTDEPGMNPPHLKARKRYEEIVESGKFICTHEHGDNSTPERVEFHLTDSGIVYESPTQQNSREKGISGKGIGTAAVESIRRSTPSTHTGYGK
jgi:beta-lactamase superfamily II metal-dependent hydrolase